MTTPKRLSLNMCREKSHFRRLGRNASEGRAVVLADANLRSSEGKFRGR